MILLFFLSTAAGYLAVSAVCAWRTATRQTIKAAAVKVLAALAVLGVTCLTLVLPLLDRLPILTWNELSRYLSSPPVAVVTLGILAGCVLHHWLTAVDGNDSWHAHPRVYWLWIGVLGTLFAMGVGLPYFSMIADITGVRSLQTAGVHVEFGAAVRPREPLTFEVVRHEFGRQQDFVKAASEHRLPRRLLQDMMLYRRLADHEVDMDNVLDTDARRILSDLKNAQSFFQEYLAPVFYCAQRATQDYLLDQTQTVQNFLPFGHGLRRALQAGRTFVQEQPDSVSKEMQDALRALGAGVRHAAATFCPIAGIDGDDVVDDTWFGRSADKIAALSQVPHLYVFLAWLYMSADDLETALKVLEEGDPRGDLVVFRNDMNYNRARALLLYLLERPLEESIAYQDRGVAFANRVVEAIPQEWADGEPTRDFVLRYAAAQRVLRQELAFLLAQQPGAPRIHEALDYARTFFEETGHWERTWRWGMQWGRYFEGLRSIKIGPFDDWSRDDIYWGRADAVLSYLIYGYTLMVFGALDIEANAAALVIARDLFEEGLQAYKTHEQELRQDGQHATYIRLQSSLAQANRLLKDASHAP